jgi:hypothetical protein
MVGLWSGDAQRHGCSNGTSALPSLPLAVLQDTVPLVLSRQLVQVFAQELGKLPAELHRPAAQL